MSADSHIVGRDAELEQVRAVLAGARRALVPCLLTGPPGIGKTTIWREGVKLADGAGFSVLRTRPRGSEVRLSYSGLSDLVGPLDEELLERLPVVQRRALEVALLRDALGSDAIEARAVASGLGGLLRRLAADRPLLVAVDDAQWLDAASASALAYSLRRLEDAPIAVLATARFEGSPPETFIDALPSERLLSLRLNPLDVAAIGAVLRRQLELSLPPPALGRLAAATGGNPMHALEVARELKRLGSSTHGQTLPVPEDLRALLTARLERLGPETREALLTAASLAAPRTDLVEEEHLAPAEEAGIVRIVREGTIEFTHPLFAAAVHATAPAARRHATHRRLAGLVADPEERARHLALGARGPDETVAVSLEKGAETARARGAPATAAELAELALELGSPESDHRCRRLLTAAACHLESGDLERARELLEQAVEQAPGALQRATALRLLGQLQMRLSSFAEALRIAGEGRSAVLSAPVADSRLIGELELDLAFYAFNSGGFPAAEEHAQAAVKGVRATGDEPLMASALAVRTIIAFLRGKGLDEEDLRWALEHEDPGRPIPVMLRPRLIAGFIELCRGEAAQSLARLGELRADLLARGQESETPTICLYLVWAATWAGEGELALSLAEEGLALAQLLEDRMADAVILSAAAIAHAHAGHADRAREHAQSAMEHLQRLAWPPGFIFPLWGLGLLELSLDRPEAAYAILGPLAEQIGAIGPADPSLTVFLPDAVEALIDLDRATEARELLDPFERKAVALDRAWAIAASLRCRALLAAGEGDLEGARENLSRALEQHDRLPLLGERARTLLALGRVLRRARQRKLAREAVLEALAGFERAGMTGWAARAQEDLRRLGAAPALDATLTPTELRIAELAVSGLTNREIAAQAFVSVKTVEARLASVYRKLGIRSRAQLSSALAELLERPTT